MKWNNVIKRCKWSPIIKGGGTCKRKVKICVVQFDKKMLVIFLLPFTFFFTSSSAYRRIKSIGVWSCVPQEQKSLHENGFCCCCSCAWCFLESEALPAYFCIGLSLKVLVAMSMWPFPKTSQLCLTI